MQVVGGVARCIVGLALIGVGLCLSTYVLVITLGRALSHGLLFVLAFVVVLSGSVLVIAGATYFCRAAYALLHPKSGATRP